MRHTISVICISLSIAGFLPLGALRADELPPLSVNPSQTKVLVLPTLDETGDRAEMQREHTLVANHRMEYEFMTRGFQVIGPKEALRAARVEGIDLDDPDGRGSNSLKLLGRDTGADWVLSAAVIDVHEDRGNGIPILFYNRRAYAKVQLKIYDMHQDGYIENRFEQQHKTTIRALPGPNGIGTTGLFKDAIDTTMQRGVANLLAPYAQSVTVADEFGQNDLVDDAPSPVSVTAPIEVAPVVVHAQSSAVRPTQPAPIAAKPASPIVTRFVKKNGDIVIGVIDRRDEVNGLYFVKIATGTTLVKDSDIVSMSVIAGDSKQGDAK